MRFQMRLHQEHDADVIAWLEAQPDKTEAVKALIQSAQGNNVAGPQLGQYASSSPIDLVAIRQVFEAVLDEKLANLGAPAVKESSGGDPELERKIDQMF